MKKGELVTFDNIRSVRPGFGMHPKHTPVLLGKKFNQNISKGARMSFDFIN